MKKSASFVHHRQALSTTDAEEPEPELCLHELPPERFRRRQETTLAVDTIRGRYTILPHIQETRGSTSGGIHIIYAT